MYLKTTHIPIHINKSSNYINIKHIEMNRPKQFEKGLNNGSKLNHFNSINHYDRYYRFIVTYDSDGVAINQGIFLKIILK